jgi:hypothetical protein
MQRISTSNILNRLNKLYASGYRRETLERSVEKLLDAERAAIERELVSIRARLAEYETKYRMKSDAFIAQYKSGKLGDRMDFFEWSAYCDLRESAIRQLELLNDSAAT